MWNRDGDLFANVERVNKHWEVQIRLTGSW